MQNRKKSLGLGSNEKFIYLIDRIVR